MTNAGMAKNQLGSYEQAVAWFRRAIEANRNFPQSHFSMAAALAQLGRLDEARCRRQGRSRAQPGLHHLPRPRLSGRRRATTRRIWPSSRAHFRRPAKGRSCPNNDRDPPPVASPRSSPPTSPATRASWARTRRGRRGLCASIAMPRGPSLEKACDLRITPTPKFANFLAVSLSCYRPDKRELSPCYPPVILPLSCSLHA